MKKILTALLWVALVQMAQATDLRAYLVGNSLTDGMGVSSYPPAWDVRDMLQRFIADSGVHTIEIGTCKTAGAPLSWLWNEVDHAALASNGPWTILTLQPYGRSLYDANYPGSHAYDWGDVTNAKNFIHQALGSSPDIQPYIYSHWPDVPNYQRHDDLMKTGLTWEEAEAVRQQALADFEASGGWDGHWNRSYTNIYSSVDYRTRDYFEQLLGILNTDRHTPGDPIAGLQHEILMIPVGDVMYELSQRIKSNPTLLPRAASAGGGYYTNMLQMHADIPHLRGGVGRFIGVATWYATLYGESPAGLDYTIYNDSDPSSDQYYDYADPYYEEITPEFAAAICDAAWDVVSMHPLAGVATADADGDELPDWWEAQYFGGATNANPSAMASNGVNTIRQAYVAGLDPVDPDAKFSFSNVRNRLSWNEVFGRAYTIYWSSNLLSGFNEVLHSNVTGGAFTDTLHSAEQKGFYRLEVQLEP